MKIRARVLLIVGCVLLLGVSWILALTGKTDVEKQVELITRAEDYLTDEIYVYAVPLLEEAAAYDAEYTGYAESRLKEIYAKDLSRSDYVSKYEDLLIKQMAREDAGPDIFSEAADFYFTKGEYGEAFGVLRDGISRTESDELIAYYESTRYEYSMSGNIFDDVTSACQGAVQVKRGGYWGAATASGGMIIPCEYDSISTWNGDRFIVKKDGVISAVNGENERIALLHGEADGFTNVSQDRLGLIKDGEYVLANSNFAVSEIKFEKLGMFSENYAPAEMGGKWGLVGLNGTEWLLEPSYSEIIMDELGRSLCQNSIFARGSDGAVVLLSGGAQTGGPYDDARPFADGWAAVKKDGKWGFVDTDGQVTIDFQFEDARSFGQHLAAVKKDGLWGYVSLRGEIVIDPIFQDAKSFCNGSAAVKTDAGWQFITLLEYEEGYGQ